MANGILFAVTIFAKIKVEKRVPLTSMKNIAKSG